MTRSLLILGCGGHGRVVAEAATACGYTDLAFLDDAPAFSLAARVVGPIASLESFQKSWPEAFVAIGHGETRLALFLKLVEHGFKVPNIAHPSSIVSASARLASGIFIAPGAIINSGARIENAAIINTRAVIEHDCHIGRACHVAPGAILSGNVTVSELAWLGTGCAVRQGISIGARAVVGVGAAVVADIVSGQTVVGVPARPMKTH